MLLWAAESDENITDRGAFGNMAFHGL